MTLMPKILQEDAGGVQQAAAGVEIVHKPEGLNTLKNAGCAAVVWERPEKSVFQDWINALSPNDLPSMRQILHAKNVRKTVSDECVAVGLTDSSHRQDLIADITRLTYRFCELMNAPYVRLRLDRVTTNACRKFHMDAITARLVCTYRGTGTQYGSSMDSSDPETVFTVPTGSPILLRGKLWPKDPSAGLLHRSPPIEGSGETRLVLVLDPVFHPDEEA